MLIVLLPLGVWVVVIVAMRSEGVDPKSMEGVLGDRADHLAADHHIHHDSIVVEFEKKMKQVKLSNKVHDILCVLSKSLCPYSVKKILIHVLIQLLIPFYHTMLINTCLE